MTITDMIGRDTVRRTSRARRAAFAAECLLHASGLLLFTAMFALLWSLQIGPPFLRPGGLWALAAVVLVVGAAGAGALHRYRRPDRTVPVALAVLAVQSLALTLPLGTSPVALLGWMLEMGPGPVLLGALVRRARPVVGVLATAVLVAVAVAMGSFVPLTVGDGGPVLRILDLGPAVVIALLPAAVGVVLRALDTTRRTAELARVRAEERLQVARELHDLIGNHVTGMTMYAQVAAADADVPDRVRDLLTAIEAAGGDALAAMRRMVGALRSDDGLGTLDAMPATATTLEGAVHEAVGTTAGVTGTVTVAVDPGLTAPSPDVVATVHRVVVEALTNVRRHAPHAPSIAVSVAPVSDDRVAVEVVNGRSDGPRAAPAPGSGLGLLGLRERVDALDGQLDAGPVAGGGWRVRAELPHVPSPQVRSAGQART